MQCIDLIARNQRERPTNQTEEKRSPSPLPKLPRPLLILPQPITTNARPNRVQTGLEVVEPDWPDRVHGRVQEVLAERAAYFGYL